MSLTLWAVFPYVCITLFFVVPFFRLRKRPFEYTTRATSMFARDLLGAASLLLHWGIIILLIGHTIGIVGAVLGLGSWVRAFFYVGAVGGVMAVSGSIIALARRFLVPEVRALSQHDDYGVHFFLIAIMGVALYQSLVQWIWGASFNAGLWLASIFRFRPMPELMAGAPLYTQLHVLLAFGFLAYFPFTKLVHAWTLPVNYLVRPYQSMRTSTRKFQRRFELRLRTDTSMLLYSTVLVFLLLLGTGTLLRTPWLPGHRATVTTATSDQPTTVQVTQLATTAAGAQTAAQTAATPAVLRLEGYPLYLGSCARCHGPMGDARVLSRDSHSFAVPPRDLRQGRFRFVSTTNGVASDADLRHVIQHGLPVSGMPSFRHLSDAQLDSLVEVIDYLWAGRPPAGPAVDTGTMPPFTTAMTRSGQDTFATVCSVCHGATGHGDGPAATGLPTPPADLAGGQVKAGTTATQLYYRIAAGIAGDEGPEMPAFGGLGQEQIWSIVSYLQNDVLPVAMRDVPLDQGSVKAGP